MGRQDHPRIREKWVIKGRGFGLEHIQPCRGHRAILERHQQGRLIDNATARRVADHNAAFHFPKGSAIQQRALGGGDMHRDEISLSQGCG